MFKLEKLVWSSNKRKVEKFGKGTHFHMERAAHGASEYQIRNNMLKHFQKVLNANEQDVEFSLKTNELLEIYIDGQFYKKIDCHDISRDAFISAVIKEFF
jgi:hypothetical protein